MTKEDTQRKLLKELRSKLVGVKTTLPYTIYRDADIEALVKAQPKTLDDLGKIKGFPSQGKRYKNYGESILAVFRNPSAIESFEIDETKPVAEIIVKAVKSRAFL